MHARKKITEDQKKSLTKEDQLAIQENTEYKNRLPVLQDEQHINDADTIPRIFNKFRELLNQLDTQKNYKLYLPHEVRKLRKIINTLEQDANHYIKPSRFENIFSSKGNVIDKEKQREEKVKKDLINLFEAIANPAENFHKLEKARKQTSWREFFIVTTCILGIISVVLGLSGALHGNVPLMIAGGIGCGFFLSTSLKLHYSGRISGCISDVSDVIEDRVKPKIN